MRGRIFGIKKSLILTTSFVLLTALFIAFTLVTLLVFDYKYLWFFIFCLACGVYQLLKGVLFKFDSAFYFGVLLLSVGSVGFFVTFAGFSAYQSVLYLLAFAVASFFTYVFFNQKFHLHLAILLYFVTLFWFWTKIKVISSLVFVAILCVSVLLFIIIYLSSLKLKGKAKGS